MSGFINSLAQAAGGNLGNYAPGYRDMMQQVAQTKDTDAQTEQRKTETYAKQMQMQQQQRIQDFQTRMAAMARGSDAPDPKDPESVASYYNKAADQARKEGLINAAADMDEEAAKLRIQGANAKRAGAQAVVEQLKAQDLKNEDGAARLYGVTTEQEFQQAVKGTSAEGMPWEGPQTAQKAREQLMGIKTQLSERLKNAEQTDKHLKTEAEIRRSEAQAQRLRDQTRIQNEQLQRKAGKELKNSATAPSKQEISDASALLLNAYPGLRQDKVEQEIDGKPTTKFPSLATASAIVAADAKKRMQGNPALSWEQAAHQSIYAHKNSFQDIGKTTKFIGGGDSADEALPVPKSVIEDRDPAALTKDKFYELPSGRVGRWTGTGFVFDDDTPPDEEE